MEQFGPLLSLGVGGVVAAIVMYWKRQDDAAHKATLRAHAEELSKLNGALIKVVSANTRAMTALQIAIRPNNTYEYDDPTEAHP